MGSKPISQLETRTLVPPGQIDTWARVMSPSLEARVDAAADAIGFPANYEAHVAGPLIVGRIHLDAHIYNRDDTRMHRDGFNHFQLNLHLKGGYAGRLGMRNVVAGPGDISLLDFGRPMIIATRSAELIVVALPRDVIEKSLPKGDHHGLVLAGASSLGGLLADHLRALDIRIGGMTAEEASAAAQATCAMISVCFYPSCATFGSSKSIATESPMSRIQRYIAENLQNIRLDAAHLCAAFHLSRATLYRLFAPLGGIAGYLRDQRLSQAFTTLLNPLENHRRISQIAFQWGFTSESHFSRAFRKTFGMTPRGARSLQGTPAEGSVSDLSARMRR